MSPEYLFPPSPLLNRPHDQIGPPHVFFLTCVCACIRTCVSIYPSVRLPVLPACVPGEGGSIAFIHLERFELNLERTPVFSTVVFFSLFFSSSLSTRARSIVSRNRGVFEHRAKLRDLPSKEKERTLLDLATPFAWILRIVVFPASHDFERAGSSSRDLNNRASDLNPPRPPTVAIGATWRRDLIRATGNVGRSPREERDAATIHGDDLRRPMGCNARFDLSDRPVYIRELCRGNCF